MYILKSPGVKTAFKQAWGDIFHRSKMYLVPMGIYRHQWALCIIIIWYLELETKKVFRRFIYDRKRNVASIPVLDRNRRSNVGITSRYQHSCLVK